MTTRKTAQRILVAAAGASLLAAFFTAACGGGGGYGGGTPTTPSPTGGVGATVTLSANGVSDAAPRINIGEKIRFTNSDSRPHQIYTTPHFLHTDCPALNKISTLSPGQSGESDPLTDRRGCGFHDHLNPDDTKFRGQVLVGLSSGDPVPPPPGYVRP